MLDIATAEGAHVPYESGVDVVKVGVLDQVLSTTRVIAGVGVPRK